LAKGVKVLRDKREYGGHVGRGSNGAGSVTESIKVDGKGQIRNKGEQGGSWKLGIERISGQVRQKNLPLPKCGGRKKEFHAKNREGPSSRRSAGRTTIAQQKR